MNASQNLMASRDEARDEILRAAAEGRMSPEDAARALFHEPLVAEDTSTLADAALEGGPPPTRVGGAILDLLGVGRELWNDAARGWRELSRPPSSPARRLDVAAGGFDLFEQETLRITPRFSLDRSMYNDPLVVWGVDRSRVRLLRGEPLRIVRSEIGVTLDWGDGPLELEVPRRLAGLFVRAYGSDVSLFGYDSPLQVDLLRGRLEVRSSRAPVMIRALAAPVVLRECALHHGESQIVTSGGDIRVELANAASLRIHAAVIGGRIECDAAFDALPEGPRTARSDEPRIPRARREILVGGSTGRLSLESAGGWIYLAPSATERSTPTGSPTGGVPTPPRHEAPSPDRYS